MGRLGQWIQLLECALLPALALCVSTLSHGPVCAKFFYNTASDGTCWLHWYIIFFGGVITMNAICCELGNRGRNHETYKNQSGMNSEAFILQTMQQTKQLPYHLIIQQFSVSVLFIVQILHRRWKSNIHVEYELLDVGWIKRNSPEKAELHKLILVVFSTMT